MVGGVLAYFLDPVVHYLQRAGLSRTWATTMVTVAAALIAIGAATAIVPPLLGELQNLIVKAPQLAVQAVQRVQPMIEPLLSKLGFSSVSVDDLQSEATQWIGRALGVAGSVAGGLAQRGVAAINLLSLLFLTPVVTFYLLRDWEKAARCDRPRAAPGSCRDRPHPGAQE